MAEWIEVTLKVVDALEALNINYVICGSAASIIHGVVRSTVDADLIADLKPEHAEPLVAALEKEFYIEPEFIMQAIKRKSSFNVIHQSTMFKVDVFVPKIRVFDQAQLSHRVQRVFGQNPDRSVWFLSAEDIVLAKLEWFKIGGEVSERQWRDILGVLKIQRDKLDVDYMRKMGATLGVAKLLEAALEAAK